MDVFNPTFSTPKDAVIRVDSLTLIKDSNTITDVIEGVTLQLTGESSTTANRITVSQGDVSGTATYIQDFVTAYNTVIDDLSNAFAYDPDNPTSNPLRGDYTVPSSASPSGRRAPTCPRGSTSSCSPAGRCRASGCSIFSVPNDKFNIWRMDSFPGRLMV